MIGAGAVTGTGTTANRFPLQKSPRQTGWDESITRTCGEKEKQSGAG